MKQNSWGINIWIFFIKASNIHHQISLILLNSLYVTMFASECFKIKFLIVTCIVHVKYRIFYLHILSRIWPLWTICILWVQVGKKPYLICPRMEMSCVHWLKHDLWLPYLFLWPTDKNSFLASMVDTWLNSEFWSLLLYIQQNMRK